jgi:hypothetical protein
MLGGAVAFLWTAGWAIYIRKYPEPVARHGTTDRRQRGLTAAVSNVPLKRLAIWATGLVVLLGVWYGWKLYLGTQATYFLCIGEYRGSCGSTDWVNCGTDMQAYVKNAHPDVCVYVKATRLSDVSGNKCGYATYKFDCSNRPQ